MGKLSFLNPLNLENMKIVLLLMLMLPGLLSSDNNQTFIDPTGTYILKGEVRDNHVVTHSGEIRVKLLGPTLLALCFYIDRGYPKHESGSFLDTLRYDDNSALYASGDSACMLRFAFRPNGVELIHVFSMNKSDCGFTPGVLTGAFFKKASSGIPVIQSLAGMRATAQE
jgi:hypothetical protein